MAIEYIRAHLGRRVPIGELVAATGVSERTLHKHFNVFMDASPFEYGLRLRLLAVRQRLETANDCEPITSLATQFGFTHFGRFSGQYSRAFGEAPSATRRKAIDKAASASRTNSSQAPSQKDRPELVILPFACSPADPDQVAFAGALAESIAATFASERQISARTSTAVDIQGRGSPVSRYFIRGQVLAEHRRLRVILTLVDAVNQSHVWGDSFDGIPSTRLALIDRVVTTLRRAVLPNIRRSEITRARRKRFEDANVRELCLQAWPLLMAGSPMGARRALDLLSKAVQLDPDDAGAAGMAAWAHSQLIQQNFGGALDRTAAVRLAARAGILDDDDPMVLTARGTVYTAIEEFDTATTLIDRAIARDPSLPWAWQRRGWLSLYAGESKIALKQFMRAIQLDTTSMTNTTCLIGIGCVFFDTGRYDLAVKWMRRALNENPDAIWANRTLSVAYARIGERQAANRALASFRKCYPDVTIANVTSVLHFRSNFIERVAAGLNDLGLPSG